MEQVTIENTRTSRVTACMDASGKPLVFVPAVRHKTGLIDPSRNVITKAQYEACLEDRGTRKLFDKRVLRMAAAQVPTANSPAERTQEHTQQQPRAQGNQGRRS